MRSELTYPDGNKLPAPASTTQRHPWSTADQGSPRSVLLALGLCLALLAPSAAMAQVPDGWAWAKRLYTTKDEYALSNAVDTSLRMVYTAGIAEDGFQGLSVFNWSGIFGTSTQGDGYLAKQDLDGGNKWQFIVGGAGDDGISGVCTDPAGQVYIAGWFSGNNASFKGVSGSDQWMSSDGGRDIFVACYSPAGILQWKTRVGGAQDETATDICYANGRLFVTGAYRSGTAAGPVLPSHKAALIALEASDGNVLWQLFGGNAQNSSFNAVAADGENVYAIGDHKGATYTYFSTNGTSSTLTTPTGNRSANVVAVGHDGDIRWTQAIANPLGDEINASGIAVSEHAVYVSGSTHNNSTFPGGTVVSATGSPHDHGYLARLDKGNGTTQWVRTFSGTVSHAQVGLDLATDNHGDVLMSGTYNATGTFPEGPTITGTTGLRIFLAKYDAAGSLKWVMNPPGTGNHLPFGVATDRAGKVFIAGSHTQALQFIDPWSDGNSKNLFMAGLTDIDHAVQDIHDPSHFTPFGPICENSDPIDLGTMLIPQTAGCGASVFAFNNVSNPNGALGTDAGNPATFTQSGSAVNMDLGVTVPAGEQLIIRWRKGAAGAEATLNVQGRMQGSDPYTTIGSISTSGTDYILTSMTVSLPVRQVRIWCSDGVAFQVDGVFHAFGSGAGGVWSGPGITNDIFNPEGQAGEAAITYTVQGQSTTHLVTVDPLSVGGHLNGGGEICPGSDVMITLAGATGQPLSWYWKADNASLWNDAPSNMDTFTLTNVAQPIQVYAEVASGTCPTAQSDTITVLPQDHEAPVFINCPNDTIVYAPATACQVQVAYQPPVATDNCGEPLVHVDDAAHQPGQFFPIGTTTIRYIADDGNGNTAICEFQIAVVDTISPSITCPGNITVGTNLGCAASGIDLGTPVASDNCTSFILSNTAPTVFPIGANTVVWTAKDPAGNMASCNQVITVIDDVPPTIICPDKVEVFTDAGCGALNVALGNASVNDNCSTMIHMNDAPSFFPVDTTIVTWTVSDARGNQASCTQLVIVIDNVAPTITCPDPVTVSTNTGCTATGVELGSPVTNDNCRVDQVWNNGPAAFVPGNTTVTWTVADPQGNTATCGQVITVIDDVAPTIICPDTVEVFTNASCTAINVALGVPVAADNCGVFSVANDAPATFPLHSTVVTWTVTDNSANTGTCTQIVEVIDNVPPSITCPVDITTSTNDGCTATGVMLGTPVILDHCDTPSVSNDAPLAFPLGVTVVTWTATDASGNSGACTQQVTVFDNTPPVAACRPVSILLDDDGVATVTAAQVDNGSTDNCTVASITLTTTAYYVVGTYTDTLIVTDAAGNSDTCFATITVLDENAPTAICNDLTLYLDSNGSVTIAATDLDGGSFDNGAIVALDVSQTTFTCEDLGNNEVTLTVTDDGGNTNFCIATITVLDTITPVISCPSDITLSAGANCSVATPATGAPVANDNCSGFAVTNNAPAVLPLGLSTVTWTVTDSGGNTASCTQEITVIDDTPPEALCRPVSILLDGDGVATVTASQVDNGSTDNCTVASITLTTTAYYVVGTYTDTLIVTDAAGNSDICFATITVLDENAPTAICNDLTLYLSANGNATITATDLDGGSFDNGLIVAWEASQTAFSCEDLGNNEVTLTVTDDGGNTNFCIANITVLDTITPNTGGFATANFCPDGATQDLSIFITEELATNGSWSAPDGSTASGVFNPAMDQPGLYTYAAPSLAGCSTDTFRVEVGLYPLPFAGSDTSLTLCSTGPEIDLFSLIPGAESNGTWSIGTSLFTPSTPGSTAIHYIVQSAHGCAPDTAFIALSVTPAPHAGSNANLDICADAAAVDLFTLLGNSPDAGGSWTAPDGSPFTGPYDPAQHEAGNYTYTVGGTGPCASSSSIVTITKVDAPSAAWTAPGPICASAGMLDLTPYVTGAAGGTWSGAGISNGHFFNPQAIAIDGASAQVELEYTVSVAGCNASATGTITVDAIPAANAGSDASVCGLGHTFTPVATIGTGTWSSQATASIADPHAPNSTVMADVPGTYTFLWTVVNGTCSATDSMLITFHLPEELTMLDAGGDQRQDLNTSMELNGRADGATESWWSVVHGHGVFDDANALDTRVRDLAIGENIVVLSARVGSCPAERDTVILTVSGLVVPTGFSPNGDGVNDSYVIRGLEELPPISLYVYDRWGNPVFHADHYRNDWSGNGDNGQPLMDGTYFGILTIAGQDPWKGNITLKR